MFISLLLSYFFFSLFARSLIQPLRAIHFRYRRLPPHRNVRSGGNLGNVCVQNFRTRHTSRFVSLTGSSSSNWVWVLYSSLQCLLLTEYQCTIYGKDACNNFHHLGSSDAFFFIWVCFDTLLLFSCLPLNVSFCRYKYWINLIVSENLTYCFNNSVAVFFQKS